MYNQAILQSMSSSGIKQLFKKGKVFWGHLFIVIATEVGQQEELPSKLSGLLQQYNDVFVEPTSLPPKRQHDHFIPLKPASTPVSIRPYRYNYFQKNEIEK